MKPIDVALVGCGHMGGYHALAVQRHPSCRLVAAVDIVSERAKALAARVGAEARSTVPEGAEAVIVATPTTTHGEVAAPLLRAGRWCLVEKPLADSVAAARALASPRLVVGHIERFNPAVRAAGSLKPRYVEARRLAPATARSEDVDVVMDLMIHDLDLLLHWSEGEVAWMDAVGVAVRSDRVDVASVRLRTTDGVTASLLASRVASRPERSVRLFERGRSAYLDLLSGRARRQSRPVPRTDARDALTAQLDAFVARIRGEAAPGSQGLADSRAGLRAVGLAEQIESAIAVHGRTGG